MLDEFAGARKLISSELKAFLAEKRTELASVNPFGADICKRLADFALRGKMIRGCLVFTGYELGPAGRSAAGSRVLAMAGAAMELFQSGLLIHDDIMDRDLTRRGGETIFQQYASSAEREGVVDWRHLGESLGTCAGDIAYFLGFELLGRLEISPTAQEGLVALCGRELATVGVAQMQDVAWGASPSAVPREHIVRLYTHKTGRYTFSLPLAAGGRIAGADEPTLAALEKIGEHLGVVFQVRDDELNLFGEEGQTGKPVGSDIREGKKTLFLSCLLARSGGEESRRLSEILERRAVSPEDLVFVRDLGERLGVRQEVLAVAEEHAGRARSLAEQTGGQGSPGRETLLRLLDYCRTRTR